MAEATTTSNRAVDRTRAKLAFWVVCIGAGGVLLLAIATVWLSPASERAETVRLVFSSVLPLLGTWVGTVLAFYFARESLDAATESTRALLQTDDATPVREVMIPKSSIEAYVLEEGKSADKIRISDLFKRMQAAKRQRLPIVRADWSVAYVVHMATLRAFADTDAAMTLDATDKRLSDLLAVPDLAAYVSAIAVVGPNATVGDARNALSAVAHCNDVFVTRSAQRTDPIVGWLTNTLLASEK